MSSSIASAQPAAKIPPKSPSTVLADNEAQWLFTEEELRKTPSVLDGMAHEDERELRTKGINFIMQVGMMLKLPQLTLSTASVFFHRFLMRHSLVNKPDQPKALHHYQVAATALFLATKTEENIRRMKELIVSCCRVAQKNPSLIVDEQSKDFWRWRDTILFNEDVLLEALCFDLTTDSPHRILFNLLKYLSLETNKKLRNAAWAFVNDSSLTMLCLLFPARVIAAAAVYCAARHCDLDAHFSECDDAHNRTWWEVHDMVWVDIKKAVNYMAELYDQNASRQSGEQSIYMPASPGEWQGPNDVISQAGSDRTLERGVKRERSVEPPVLAVPQTSGSAADQKPDGSSSHAGTIDDDRDQKRQKFKTNSIVTTTAKPKDTVKQEEDPVSEEGEVEE